MAKDGSNQMVHEAVREVRGVSQYELRLLYFGSRPATNRNARCNWYLTGEAQAADGLACRGGGGRQVDEHECLAVS